MKSIFVVAENEKNTSSVYAIFVYMFVLYQKHPMANHASGRFVARLFAMSNFPLLCTPK